MIRKTLIAAVLALSCSVATHAAPLTYDAGADGRKELLLATMYQTLECMRSMSHMLLIQGHRDEDVIAGIVAKTCGGPLRPLFGVSDAEATTMLVAMGRSAVRNQPGVRR